MAWNGWLTWLKRLYSSDAERSYKGSKPALHQFSSRSRGRRAFPCLEPLEERTLPTVQIQFNFSDDVNGFFNDPARRQILQTAADNLTAGMTNTLSAITPGGGNSWQMVFLDPAGAGMDTVDNPTIPANTLVVYAGGQNLPATSSELGEGGPGGFNASGSNAFLDTISNRGQSASAFSPWGGAVTFTENPIGGWYFGTDPSQIDGQNDFLSVATHELGHLLGIGTATQWDNLVSNGTFTGPNAEAAYGNQPVPLDQTEIQDPGAHWAQTDLSGGLQPAMTPILLEGTRKLFTPLDFAGLEDLGWQYQPASPAGPTVTSISPSSALLPGATTVTITGMNLANATAVHFGAIPATINSDSPTQIIVTSPAGAAGSVDVTVTTAAGVSPTSPADKFSYVEAFSLSQSIVSATPSNVVAGGVATVTLTARDANGNQEPTGGLTVAFRLGAGAGVGTIGPVIDNGDGVYTATFTAAAAGSNTITATINNQAVTAPPPLLTVTSNPNTASYQLKNDGNLYQTVNGVTTLFASGVDAFSVSGGNLLELEDNGQLYLHNSAGWRLLDVGGAAFQSDNSGNVAILEDNGTLRLYPVGGPLTLTPVASNVKSIAVTASGAVYFLDNSGNLSVDVGGTISPVDSSVQSFQFDRAGNRYELLSNGNLTENATPLASNVTSFVVSGTGIVTDLSGATLQQAGNTVAGSAAAFAAAPDGTLYYLTTGGAVMKQGSSAVLDAGVSSITLASDGALYELQSGALIQRNGATRTQLDAGVQSIAVADNGALYDLGNSGALYLHTIDGWTFEDAAVQQILLPHGGALLDLKSSGVLWQHNSAGWSQLDHGVAALSLASDGFTADLTDAGGARTLTGIVSALTNSTNTVLYDLLDAGSLWQYASGRWTTLDGGAASIAITANNLLLDLETNGALCGYTGSGWEALGQSVLSYTVAGDQIAIVTSVGARQLTATSGGTGYELLNDGSLSQITTAGTTLFASGVDAFSVSGGNLLELEDNGQLYLHGAAGWRLLDVGVAAFQSDSSGNVAILEDNGTLRLDPVGGPLTLSPAASNVKSIAETASGAVYFLDNSGNLSKDVGGNITPVDSSVQSFQLDGAGNRYELLSNGNLTENATPLASNVTSFVVSSTGIVTDLSGATLQQAGNTVAGSAAAFAAAPDGTLYYLTTGGAVMKQGSSAVLDAGVSSITLASDGALYELQSGALIQRNGATRTQLDAGVQSIAVADNGALYDLGNSGALYLHTIDGWTFEDAGVQKILLPHGGALLDLESSGVLWQHNSAGWTKLDSGVTTLGLANDGFTANVSDGNGARTLTGLVTSLANNPPTILDELFSDGSLWQYTAGAWALLDSGVQAIGVSSDGTLIDLQAGGNLYSHLGSRWTLLDSDAASFLITGNSVQATDGSGGKTFTV